jgi:hypothetical protein
MGSEILVLVQCTVPSIKVQSKNTFKAITLCKFFKSTTVACNSSCVIVSVSARDENVRDSLYVNKTKRKKRCAKKTIAPFDTGYTLLQYFSHLQYN